MRNRLILLFWLLSPTCFAQTSIDSVRTSISTAPNDSLKAWAMIQLHSAHKSASHIDSAYHYLVKAKEFSKNSTYRPLEMDNLEGVALMQMASIEVQFRNEKDSALKHLEIAKDFFVNTGDFKHLAGCNLILGVIHYYGGEFEKALAYHQKSSDTYKKIKDSVGLAGSYNNLGLTYAKLDQLEKSIASYQESVKLNKTLGMDEQTASALNNIGGLYTSLSKYDLAIEYFKKGHAYGEKSGDKIRIARGLNNIGSAYRYAKQLDSALVYFKRSQKMVDELGLEGDLINTLNNIGLIHYDRKEYVIAESYFEEGLEKAKSINDDDKTGMVSGNLAMVYNAYGKYNKAIELSLDGLESAKKHRQPKRLINIYSNLQISYEGLKDLDKTLLYYEKKNSLDDSLKSIENKEIIARMEGAYKLEQQQMEIDRQKATLESKVAESEVQNTQLIILIVSLLLSLVVLLILYRAYSLKTSRNKVLSDKNDKILEQKKKIADQAQELRSSNEAKDKLFSVIAHDLQGPVHGINQALEILKKDHKRYSEAEMRDLLAMLSNSSTQTSELLSSLLDWARFQIGQLPFNPIESDITTLIDSNISLFSAIASRKEIKLIRVSEGPVTAYFDENMVNSILRNLLSNALKFSSKGDVVSVGASIDRNGLRVEVTDTGIGMSEDTIEHLLSDKDLDSKNGTNGEGGSGLGLKLCREFIEKHKGSLSIISEPKKGSSFVFTLPSRL